jgi:hypothetical protein
MSHAWFFWRVAAFFWWLTKCLPLSQPRLSPQRSRFPVRLGEFSITCYFVHHLDYAWIVAIGKKYSFEVLVLKGCDRVPFKLVRAADIGEVDRGPLWGIGKDLIDMYLYVILRLLASDFSGCYSRIVAGDPSSVAELPPLPVKSIQILKASITYSLGSRFET